MDRIPQDSNGESDAARPAGRQARTGPATAIRLVIALAIALLSGLFFARGASPDPAAYGNDFNVYYFAAREILSGRDPYQNSLGEWVPYLYPPHLAEALAPLALLPVRAAAFTWHLLSLFSAGLAARLCVRLAQGARATGAEGEGLTSFGRGFVLAAALLVPARFILDNFLLGQVNVIVAALSVAHVYLYARGRKTASAVSLAAAASIKITPILLLLYHVARGRVKYAAGCALLTAAVTLAGFLPFGANGPRAFGEFASRTLNNGQKFDLAYSGNQSTRGLVARMAGEDDERALDPFNPFSLAASILLLALALVAARRARDEMAAAAPAFSCLVLLSPLSWKAHFVILMLPVALLAREVAAGTDVRRMRLVLGTLALAFAVFNFTSQKVIGQGGSEWADAVSLVWAGALLVCSCAAGAVLDREGAGWQERA